MQSLSAVLVHVPVEGRVDGYLQKRRLLLSSCCATPQRYYELDQQRRLLFIRKGPGCPCVDFIDFNEPVAIEQRAGSPSSFNIICVSRIFQLLSESPEEAKKWMEALRPLTAGWITATFLPDGGGLWSRLVEQDDGKHHGQRIWVNNLMASCRTGEKHAVLGDGTAMRRHIIAGCSAPLHLLIADSS